MLLKRVPKKRSKTHKRDAQTCIQTDTKVCVWIHVELRFTFAFSLFFFWIHAQQLLGDSALFITVCALFIKKKIKNGSHDTIHTF